LAESIPVQANQGIESGKQGDVEPVDADLNAVGRDDTIEMKSKIVTNNVQSISTKPPSSSAKSVAQIKNQNRSGLLRKKEKYLGQKGKIENRGSKRLLVGGRQS